MMLHLVDVIKSIPNLIHYVQKNENVENVWTYCGKTGSWSWKWIMDGSLDQSLYFMLVLHFLPQSQTSTWLLTS